SSSATTSTLPRDPPPPTPFGPTRGPRRAARPSTTTGAPSTPARRRRSHRIRTPPAERTSATRTASSASWTTDRPTQRSSVVVSEYPDAEGEHDCTGDHDHEVTQADRLPAQVLQDERAHRLHDVRDRIERRGDLHRVREQVARDEVRRQEQQREEDEPGG